MRLLVLTQTIDFKDPVLGFFHNWVREISKKCAHVSVVCLNKGEHDLPSNVEVFSLGKESGRSRLKYIKNFFLLIWGLHDQYDRVLVHMNQEYVLLGGWFWKLVGKPIFMWRNHQKGSFLTRLAVFLSKRVFCTSKYSFTARFKKTVIMPVGIDTEIFKPRDGWHYQSSRKNKILFLGRISPVKNVLLFIETLKILKEKGVLFVADVYGDPLPKDQLYFDMLKNKVQEFDLGEEVSFYGSVTNIETPKIYSEHKIFVNLTPSGSFDKTILEAAACGCLPVIVNKSLESNAEFSDLIAEETPRAVSDKLEYWLKMEEVAVQVKSRALNIYAEQNHSLNRLVAKLLDDMLN